MDLFKNIFSIKKTTIGTEKHKTVTILGLSFNYVTNKTEKVFQKLQKNYSKVLNRIKNDCATKKIKVAFVVSENSKWCYQSLYKLLENDEHFEPIVLISLLTSVHNGVDKTRKNAEENFNFFKSRGMNVDYLYKNGRYTDLHKFKPDLVFYEQPWDLPKKYMPIAVSKYALTFNCPYSYAILNNRYIYYNNKFHCYLFKYFIEHELNLDFYKEYDKNAPQVCKVIGHPKLDNSQSESSDVSPIWKEKDKIKVIYAPHHSFDKSLKLATFHKNSQFILDLAKKHPETTWIFKPHPRFKFAVMKVGIMTEEEINNYYDEWAKIGTVYTQGDYKDIFKSSDVMITDCASFLAEYLLTQKPIIRLVSEDGVGYNELGKKILSEYYEVRDNDELEKVFNDVALNKNDYKKENRIKLIDEIVDKNKSASEKIFNYLKALLRTE